MYILLFLECIRFQKSVFTFDKKSTKKKKENSIQNQNGRRWWLIKKNKKKEVATINPSSIQRTTKKLKGTYKTEKEAKKKKNRNE